MSAPINPQTPREFLHAWLEGVEVQYRYTVPLHQEEDTWKDMLSAESYLEIPTIFIPQDQFTFEFRITPKQY